MLTLVYVRPQPGFVLIISIVFVVSNAVGPLLGGAFAERVT